MGEMGCEDICFQLLIILMRRLRFWLKKELAKYYSRRQKDTLMSRKTLNFRTLAKAEGTASRRLVPVGVSLFVKWMEPSCWCGRTSSRQTINSNFAHAEHALFLNEDMAAGFLK